MEYIVIERGASKPRCGYVCQITTRHGLSVNWLKGETNEKTQPEIVDDDKEINDSSLEELRSRLEIKMLILMAKGAIKEPVGVIVRMIKAMQNNN